MHRVQPHKHSPLGGSIKKLSGFMKKYACLAIFKKSRYIKLTANKSTKLTRNKARM